MNQTLIKSNDTWRQSIDNLTVTDWLQTDFENPYVTGNKHIENKVQVLPGEQQKGQMKIWPFFITGCGISGIV